jgi:hypothetical protein
VPSCEKLQSRVLHLSYYKEVLPNLSRNRGLFSAGELCIVSAISHE